LLSHAAAGPVAVVATLRPEFLDALLSDPGMAQLELRPFTVRPVDTAALVDVIVKPSRVARIEVDETLARRIAADTGTGEALPLFGLHVGAVGPRHRARRAAFD
jgi:hypothetical protein